MRIGHGYDAHRLVKGRTLTLGGVKIEYEYGLAGHSDADVLAHAIADALLGAAAAGDIGKIFPDTDDRYLGIDSLIILRESAALVRDNGYRIENIDSTIIAQSPRLAPHIQTMRENIASALSLPRECVSIKATTEEGMGFTGSKEGIAAHAVCLIRRA